MTVGFQGDPINQVKKQKKRTQNWNWIQLNLQCACVFVCIIYVFCLCKFGTNERKIKEVLNETKQKREINFKHGTEDKQWKWSILFFFRLKTSKKQISLTGLKNNLVSIIQKHGFQYILCSIWFHLALYFHSQLREF